MINDKGRLRFKFLKFKLVKFEPLLNLYNNEDLLKVRGHAGFSLTFVKYRSKRRLRAGPADNVSESDLRLQHWNRPPVGPMAASRARKLRASPRLNLSLRLLASLAAAVLDSGCYHAAGQLPDLDSALTTQLQWLASTRAPSIGANTAAVVTYGNTAHGTSWAAQYAATGYAAPYMERPLASSTQYQSSYTAALLANGCITDTQFRYSQAAATPGAAYICVPSGLGTRFLSVLRSLNYFGGVTDAGNLVLFGYDTQWNRCAVLRGPFTPMATSQLLYPTSVNSAVRYVVPGGEDLCALDAAGILHCWAALPSTWADGATAWTARRRGRRCRRTRRCAPAARALT